MSQRVQQWLTAEELAAEFRVPLKTVYVWNHKGTGPPVTNLGRHVRYSRKAVDEWLAHGGTKPDKAARAS